jgi:DNA-binding transcriptional regulator YiaG
MANIAVLLKNEISRLSRKEIRREVQPLRKATAGYRREIAALKRAIASLERRSKQIAKQGSSASVTAGTGEKPTRFVAKGLVSLRRRLGLSAADLARLLGVSMQSVYNWERKKTTPRREQVAAIVAIRSLGRKEAEEHLKAMRQRRSASQQLPTRKSGHTHTGK